MYIKRSQIFIGLPYIRLRNLKILGVLKIILFYLNYSFLRQICRPFDSAVLGCSTTPPPPNAFNPESIMYAVKSVRARRSRGWCVLSMMFYVRLDKLVHSRAR